MGAEVQFVVSPGSPSIKQVPCKKNLVISEDEEDDHDIDREKYFFVFFQVPAL